MSERSADKPRICCVGDVVTDVVVRIGRQPEVGTDTPADIVMTRGGSAAGVAVSVSASGGVGRFVGSVGDDPAGAELIRDLEAHDVEPYTVTVGSTGAIVVLVDESGERSFLTDRGAAAELAAIPLGALSGIDLVHIPAYSFVSGPLAETSEDIVAQAIELDIPISISTSSVASLRDYGRERFLALLAAVQPSYLIANAAEYEFLMGDALVVPGVEHTVITSGASAAVLRKADGTDVRVRPATAKVRDSTGAGDAFTGAFLVAQLQGVDYEQSLQRGHDLARRVLSQPGFQFTA